jgi:hypothetical protein
MNPAVSSLQKAELVLYDYVVRKNHRSLSEFSEKKTL